MRRKAILCGYLTTHFLVKVGFMSINIEEVREFCISLPGVGECFPFDDVSLVFKVGGKMFGLLPLDNPVKISMKCQPEKAQLLRERYAGIEPAYHFNKKHWNQVSLLGDISMDMVKDLILHSYSLVVNSLPKSARAELSN